MNEVRIGTRQRRMAENEILKNMVMNFRVSELTMLLSFAGRSRSGRKTELQMRALELIKLRSSPINAKIRELYRSIQQQNVAAMAQTPEPSPAYLGPSTRTSSGAIPQLSPSKSSGYSASDVERSALQGRNPYTTGIAPGYYTKPAIPAAPSAPAFPIHPDVKLKKLPFFDNVSELLRPSSLVPQGSSRYHEANFVFHLTPQQATDVASSRDARPGSKIDFTNQIQMRFCLLETSCEQEDNFPSALTVKVNGKLVTLPNPIPTNKPGVEPKRPPRPVNITSLCRLSPTVANQINVQWSSDMGCRGYVAAVYIVQRLTSSDLLQRLKNKGVRPAEYTRGLIKDKLSEDADMEIATTSLKVSLVCPLGKMRMQLPCRATSCSHLQCFDASLFLQMNERKPTWICPVCDKSILYDSLAIDGYFSDILSSPLLPSESMEVQLNVDGTWTVLQVKKEPASRPAPSFSSPAATSNSSMEIETVDEGELELVCEAPPAKKKSAVVVDLTLSSSESDDGGDDETLASIKERQLNRQRSSGSQSSRPSTAESADTSTTGSDGSLFMGTIDEASSILAGGSSGSGGPSITNGNIATSSSVRLGPIGGEASQSPTGLVDSPPCIILEEDDL